MTQYRINVKGAPAHLQEKWSKLLTEKFNRFMQEREKLTQAQARLRAMKRKNVLGQLFPKTNDNPNKSERNRSRKQGHRPIVGAF